MPNVLKQYLPYILTGLTIPVLVVVFSNELKAAPTKAPAINNLKAFLMMIQYAEGTYGPNAYNMLYGGQLFSSYRTHPNRAITKSGLTSTAAGAYQILFRTWVGVQQPLQLPDFSPLSQDKAAVELIRRRGALEDVLVGRFYTAVEKCKKEWASLPGAGYGQRERSITVLTQVYQYAGGQIV